MTVGETNRSNSIGINNRSHLEDCQRAEDDPNLEIDERDTAMYDISLKHQELQIEQWKAIAIYEMKSFDLFIASLHARNDISHKIEEMSIDQDGAKSSKGDQLCFWLSVLTKVKDSQVYEVDYKPLRYLKSIKLDVKDKDDEAFSRDVEFQFNFDKNPFFDNEILTFEVKFDFSLNHDDYKHLEELPNFTKISFIRGCQINFINNNDFRVRIELDDSENVLKFDEIPDTSFFDIFTIDPDQNEFEGTTFVKDFAMGLVFDVLPNCYQIFWRKVAPKNDCRQTLSREMKSSRCRGESPTERETSFTEES